MSFFAPHEWSNQIIGSDPFNALKGFTPVYTILFAKLKEFRWQAQTCLLSGLFAMHVYDGPDR